MRTLILLAGLAMMLAGAAQAQQFLLVSAQDADGTVVVRKIEVSYIDVGALARALGGTTLNLYGYRDPQAPAHPNQPAPMNQPPAPAQQTLPAGPLTATPAPASNLNPNAPLAPLVPPGIMDIIGVR
ncbi:MAG: hypothetical protein ACYDBB_06455 [Armatimonadota bacterium]